MNIKQFCILLLLPALLIFSHTTQASATNVLIVDNGDPGYSETGIAWVTYTFPGAYNGEYRFLSHLGHTVERKGTATWEVDIPTTGKYRVDIHFRPTENRSNDADFHVYDGNGVIHKYSVNQTYHGVLSSVGWYTLGTYFWDAGQIGKVVLDGTDDNLSDEADAVRWTLQGEDTDTPDTPDTSKTSNVPLNAILLLLNKEPK